MQGTIRLSSKRGIRFVLAGVLAAVLFAASMGGGTALAAPVHKRRRDPAAVRRLLPRSMVPLPR